MKKRFMIPAAVAMALHAILLFGFRTARPGLIRQSPLDPPATPPPFDAVQIELPSDRDNPAAPAPQGEINAARPDLPPLPVRDPIAEIPMPSPLPSPRPIHTTNRLSIDPIGDPAGAIDGIGPGGPGPISSTWLDNPPRTRSQLAPVYPYEAQIAGRKGDVMVEFVVDETGHVLNPCVVRSNDPVFEEPTLRAVAKWRFEPGRKGGRVVRFRMAVPVEFSVNP